LDNDPKLAEAFHALTPGRQKGYLLHFAGATIGDSHHACGETCAEDFERAGTR
jgi:uncharacterized protein YdeI (YjbR/CyaY-like superfamily)